jgi:hypothetical protein
MIKRDFKGKNNPIYGKVYGWIEKKDVPCLVMWKGCMVAKS